MTTADMLKLAGTLPPERREALMAQLRGKVETTPARKKRGTGEHAKRKRRKLAEYRGQDTAEFLSSLEGRWLSRWRAAGGPEPERQYVFAPPRRYRADFAFPSVRVLVEVEGGIWNNGAHARGAGIRRDIEKSNLAQRQGWRVWRWSSDMIANGRDFCESVSLVKELMEKSK